MSWLYAVKPRVEPLMPDPQVLAEATEYLLRHDDRGHRDAMLLGAFQHVFEVLAVEQEPARVERVVRRGLAWLAADAAVSRQKLRAQEECLRERARVVGS